jgi:hypothetical protein
MYSLFFDPVPVLSYRNMNAYDDDWHSTWSWRGNGNLKRAVETAIPVLSAWKALRGRKRSFQRKLRTDLKKRLPGIIAGFVLRASRLGFRRIRDVRPSNRNYSTLIVEMARAVEKVSKLKLKNTSNPMLGSKALHFMLPEFFPVWDTEVIKECLSKEMLCLPKHISNKLKTDAARKYAAYVHFMVQELRRLPRKDYDKLERMCVRLSVEGQGVRQAQASLGWFYDDLSPTVFEICLMGKYC